MAAEGGEQRRAVAVGEVHIGDEQFEGFTDQFSFGGGNCLGDGYRAVHATDYITDNVEKALLVINDKHARAAVELGLDSRRG